MPSVPVRLSLPVPVVPVPASVPSRLPLPASESGPPESSAGRHVKRVAWRGMRKGKGKGVCGAWQGRDLNHRYGDRGKGYIEIVIRETGHWGVMGARVGWQVAKGVAGRCCHRQPVQIHPVLSKTSTRWGWGR